MNPTRRFRATRRAALALAALAGLLSLARAFAAGPGQAAGGRVIVLGFDGADARTIQELMGKGQMPNLQKLAEQGTFAPLGTVNPAESPTAWASLNTGQNPAKTGIPGFVKRDLVDLGENARAPAPGFGHLLAPPLEAPVPIEQFADAPIPTWSPLKLGLAIGAAALVVFLIVFALLLRLRAGVAIALSLVLAGVGVWGGMALRGWLPSHIPKMKNPLAAAPFWEAAAAKGVACVVLDGAVSFDRPRVGDEKVLSGLGVPDARGEVNGFTIYTTDELWFTRAPETPDSDTGSGGNKFKVDERKGVIESALYGPYNFWAIDALEQKVLAIDEERSKPSTGYKKSLELNQQKGALEQELEKARAERLSVPLKVEIGEGKAKVTLGHETQELAEGQWSQFYRVAFELNPLIKVHALVRAKLLHLSDPHFELYVDTLQIDPEHPPFWQPISAPPEFATELAHACGPYETVGWACMNLPFKDSVVDPITFMQDIEFTEGWREKLTYDRLAKDDWKVLMSCFSTTDRAQHMMYQYYDKEHPLYNAKAAAQTMTYFGETIPLSETIPATYRQMDRIIGKVMKDYVKDGDTLIVCGDHGFQTFRREVALNNWLLESGFLALKEPIAKQSDAGRINEYVDWSKTRAYAMGLGGVYLNLKGREGAGIVDPKDADAVMDEIAQKFLEATDAGSGKRFGKGAYKVKDTYKGPYLDRLPDMFLCFDAGWRVSWNTTGGGLAVAKDAEGVIRPAPVCSDNRKNWSGDHVSVDPSIVPCVFASNRKFKIPAGGASLLHIAPTALALAGVAVPPECDMPPLELER